MIHKEETSVTAGDANVPDNPLPLNETAFADVCVDAPIRLQA